MCVCACVGGWAQYIDTRSPAKQFWHQVPGSTWSWYLVPGTLLPGPIPGNHVTDKMQSMSGRTTI